MKEAPWVVAFAPGVYAAINYEFKPENKRIGQRPVRWTLDPAQAEKFSTFTTAGKWAQGKLTGGYSIEKCPVSHGPITPDGGTALKMELAA